MKIRVAATFSFYKLWKFVVGEEYKDLKTKSYGDAIAPAYKNFIKKGNVIPPLAPATRASRMRRKKNPSRGGTKPLYDTGRLVNSIRFDDKNKSIVAVDYAKTHLKDFMLNGNRVPARDFIAQTDKRLGEFLPREFFENKSAKMLVEKIKKALKSSRNITKF